ncbi:MAG TPA: DUF3875 domain-containing protein, partial [Flavisolibacter sp.]|nr:DUF3875 domain-containing protein [Flavisolibacter sp.]
MEKLLEEILPIMSVEHDAIVSRQGDITIGFACELPELFTLSDKEYETFHQAWIRAIKVLPKHSVFHKQDWFIESRYKADFSGEDQSFLSRSSERFFNERPYLDHECFIFLTKKPNGRKPSSSVFSNLIRRSIVPEQALKPQLLQDFLDCCGQFAHILEDSGFVRLRRLKNEELLSVKNRAGVIEKYCFLLDSNDHLLIKDISYGEGI